MAKWNHSLELADIFENDTMPFTDKRDQIVARIRAADFLPLDTDDDLAWAVEDLTDAEDYDDFDLAWERFYDWADVNRVWVNTHSVFTPKEREG